MSLTKYGIQESQLKNKKQDSLQKNKITSKEYKIEQHIGDFLPKNHRTRDWVNQFIYCASCFYCIPYTNNNKSKINKINCSICGSNNTNYLLLSSNRLFNFIRNNIN